MKRRLDKPAADRTPTPRWPSVLANISGRQCSHISPRRPIAAFSRLAPDTSGRHAGGPEGHLRFPRALIPANHGGFPLLRTWYLHPSRFETWCLGSSCGLAIRVFGAAKPHLCALAHGPPSATPDGPQATYCSVDPWYLRPEGVDVRPPAISPNSFSRNSGHARRAPRFQVQKRNTSSTEIMKSKRGLP